MIAMRLLLLATAVLMAVGLTACGGNDSNDNQASNNPGTSAGASDPFFVRVQALIANSPENTEPIAIDSITATTPEIIEPAAL